MPETAHIAMLRQVHDDLTAYAAGLSADQLVHPSACAGWDVAQVLGHLGAATEGMTATLDAVKAGGEMPAPDLQQSIWARWNAMGPDAKRDAFLDQVGALMARFESIDPTLPVELRFMPMPIPADQVAGFMVLELTFHNWDVRSPFDPSAPLFEPAVPMVFDLVSRLMQMRASATDVVEGAPVVAVELVDPAQSFGVRLGERVERVDHPENPDAVVRGTTENWLLLVSGRLGDRPLDVSGSVGLDDLRRVFPGI